MSPRRVETALGAGMVAVFLLVRIVLLVVREPFFDELFTLWLARKPFSEILPALRLDSGPPLYYFIARIPSVVALRVLSLLFATASLVLVLTRRSLGNARFVAAALLAIFPPAVLFAVDARAYALCALFITIALLYDDRPLIMTGALVLASYTHYYGILFLPLLLVRRRFVHALAGGVLVLPAIWLASMQPVQAMRWLSDSNPLDPLQTFAFVGRYEPSLFAPAPIVFVALSAIAVIAIAGGAPASRAGWLAGVSPPPRAAARDAAGPAGEDAGAPFVIIPVLLAIALALAGRTVYFPMRFESVLAVPFVLWIATSLERWRREAKAVLLAILVIAGGVTLVRGILDHATRDTDPYRAAAEHVGRIARPGERIVASGYLVLETTIAGTSIEAWPAEQALHPGWRAIVKPDLAALPGSSFVWIGERNSPEGVMLRKSRNVQPLWMNERAVIARVAPLDR